MLGRKWTLLPFSPSRAQTIPEPKKRGSSHGAGLSRLQSVAMGTAESLEGLRRSLVVESAESIEGLGIEPARL